MLYKYTNIYTNIVVVGRNTTLEVDNPSGSEARLTSGSSSWRLTGKSSRIARTSEAQEAMQGERQFNNDILRPAACCAN